MAWRLSDRPQHLSDHVDGGGPGFPRNGPIGVLATSGTIKAGIYQKRLALRGFTCGTPDPIGQGAVMRAIRLVKAGRLVEATAILRAQAEGLAASGCGPVVMACTEIPVALAAVKGELRCKLLDATEALARACIRACTTPAEAPAPSLAA